MKDENKSKPQLIEELVTTRQQMARLEAARSELEPVENALRESEEKHRTLFETMTQGVVYQAVNGEIISANPAAERILGLTLDQMQGRTSMDPRWRAIQEDGTAFPGDMHPSMVALRIGEPVRNVVMGVFNPQTEGHVWINVNATPQFRPGDDTPYQVYTTFEDITRRWRAEKALQEERDRAQGYLDIAGFIIVIEPDQTVSLINQKGCEVLGYEEQEILGRNWFDTCVPERERERVRSVFDQLMRGAVEPVEYFENAVLTKSGRERIIAWHNAVLRDEAGAIVGSLSSGEDITERKQVESERDATLAALRERTHELGERVKELDCLFGLSRLRERPGVSLEEIYQGTVELIPPAWQHPEITGARVVVDGQEFRTENFCKDAPCQQSAEIIVHGQPCGMVQVCYAEDRPECDEVPFLTEERTLLHAIAEQLGRIAEHKGAEEALRTARDDLELRVQERTADLKRSHQREQVLNALLHLSMEDISLDEQLERVLDEILSIPWLPVQPRGGIFLVGDDVPSRAARLELRAQRGLSLAAQAACRRVDFGQCLCGRAALSREVLFAERADDRHDIHYEGMEPHGHYCVPILSGDRSIGTIVLYLEEGHPRDAQQEEFLRAVAHTLAGIIERKRVEEALRHSEAGLAEAQRIAGLGNWDWDVETNQLHWSDEIYRIFGLAPQEFGATYEAFLNSVHPDDRSLVERSVEEALYKHKPYSIDHRIVLPDGSERIVHEQAEVTHDGAGQPVRMIGTVQDVTERRQAEDALRQSEQRLRELNEQLEDYGRSLEQKVAERTREIEQRRQVAESLRDILAVLNSDRPLDEVLSYIVTEARRLLGSSTSAVYRLSEPDGMLEVQTVQGQYADLVASVQFAPGYRQVLLDGQPLAVSEAAVVFPDPASADLGEIAIPHDLAGQCPAMLAVPLTVADEVYGCLKLFYSEPRAFSGEEVDLAVAFADQAALAIENARLRRQAEEAAVLEERGRLARGLHDSVTQSLYSITLLAEGWKRLDRAGRLEDSEDPLTELGALAQQALKEMRLMVHELRPPNLEEVGLLGALHQRLGAVEKRAGVDARLVADDVVELPPRVEEGLYRIAIEALNNALKHAGATSVTVRVRVDGDRVALEVMDNGRGFDVETLDARRGMGLPGMRERAEQLGGAFLVDSTPSEGTRVSVSLASHSA
jgi:PAS domain S-box-containing protein